MIKLSKSYLIDYESPSLQSVGHDIYNHWFKLENCEVWIEYDKSNGLSVLEFQDEGGGWDEEEWLSISEMNELFKPENLKKYLDDHKE
jgi:hypothetical protein